jgi:hypothetical protein
MSARKRSPLGPLGSMGAHDVAQVWSLAFDGKRSAPTVAAHDAAPPLAGCSLCSLDLVDTQDDGETLRRAHAAGRRAGSPRRALPRHR